MRKILTACLLLFAFDTLLFAQESPQGTANISLGYYLPEGYTYDDKVTKPRDFLGFEVGEWTVDYEQLIRYFEKLAETSPRVKFEVFGRTYEKRPQVLLTISSPENLGRLESIQAERQKLRDPNANVDYDKLPMVFAAGYTVHGNEASGINSSLLAAYHFAAAKELEGDLKNIVILIDPALNPDGYSRYSSWVNSHRSMNLNGDPNTRELGEAWPGGRGNHYWFDLNRDWLLVQHPESQNRVAKFQQWLPNIYLDYHEMGSNNTFFFQPAIPSRDHPLIPKSIIEMTEKIAQFHVAEFDKLGSLYYTRESFDEYYFGYGSTYPDIQGSVGILFEQASSRGHLQETKFGPLTFAFTIRNQFRASISSFEAARKMRPEFNKLMHDFYKEAKTLATADTEKAYIFGAAEDPARSFHLADIIRQHQIKVFQLNEDITVNGVVFKKERSYIVPTEQPQYRLIKAMFEVRNTFRDSLFYDVSAWTLPMSFNLDHAALSSKVYNLANVSPIGADFSMKRGAVTATGEHYAYGFGWENYYAPKAAHDLMSRGYLVRVSHEDITLPNNVTLKRGSILVGLRHDAKAEDAQQLPKDLKEIAESTGITVHALNSGYTGGYNIGSPSISVLETPSIAVLVGTGVNSLEAGEIWHLLDTRMGIPITLLPIERFGSADLDRYNVLVMPNGGYNSLSKSDTEKIKSWISSGKTLIARGNALSWLNSQEIAKFDFKEEPKEDAKNLQAPYADYSQNAGARLTSGTIFNAKIDTSHPIGYGFGSDKLFVFRNNNLFLEPAKNTYANPVLYTSQPLASGYVHPENLEKVKNTASVQIKRVGGGRIVAFVDNPNFRAIWFGTNKLFLNAVFFGQTIQSGTAD